MRIVLMQDTLPRLEGADDLRRFSIAMDERLRGSAREALAPVGLPVTSEATHAWVRPDAVRALSPLAGDPEWEAGFANMRAFAEEHGWTGENGMIRAHIDVIAATEPVSADAFRNAMRRFASGVCVVACGAGEDRRGMTVSAFSSVSAEPPMVLVCLNRGASAHAPLVTAGSFSINILGGEQEDIAMLFAGQGALKGADRFGPDWQDSHGAPVLSTAHQSLVCTQVSAHRAGTHTVLIGQVVATSDAQETGALVNYNGAIKPTAPAHPSVQ